MNRVPEDRSVRAWGLDAAENNRSLWFAAALLTAANLLVFGQVLRFEFLIWDDEFFVLPHLKTFGGLTPQSIQWAFSNRQAGWFTPIPYLSLFLDAQLFGLNPAGYHLTNLVLHIANTLLLLVVLERMTGRLALSVLTAGLFAVHPLHVEPVVWITTRWELLCGTFWLLGMGAYLAYCRRGGMFRYLIVVGCFVAALLSKPMALTFPFALLLLDVWPLRRVAVPWTREGQIPGVNDAPASLPPLRLEGVTWRRAVLEKLPLLLIMAAVLCEASRAKTEFFTTKSMVRFSLTDRLVNAVEAYGTYVAQFLWPAGLNFYYPHPALQGGFDWGRVALSAGILLGVTLLVLLSRRRALWVGWLWYLGVLVPAIGLVQVEEHARADRYTYLPLIGLAWMAVWMAVWMAAWLPRAVRARLPRVDIPWPVAAIAVLLACGLAAHRQASHWRTSEALMRYGAAADPRNFKAWYNLGHLALRDGQPKEAEGFFRRAAGVHRTGRAQYLIGRALMLQQRDEEAIAALRVSLQRQPDYSAARALLARLLLEQGRADDARAQYEEMIRRRPREPLANIWYAEHLSRGGDWAKAAEYYRRALERDEGSELVVQRLGTALEKSGRSGEAIQLYRRHMVRFPRHLNVADRLAWLLATHPDPRLRDGGESLRIAERLCRISHFENRFVLDTLATAYAEQQDFRQSIKMVHRALELAREAEDSGHVTELEGRLALYRREEPYRDHARYGAEPNPHAHRRQSTSRR